MTPEERDALIEEIAAAVEQPSLLDLAGIAARRKRQREDAEVRRKAREEQRRQIADLIRAHKTGAGRCPTTALARVAAEVERVEAWQRDAPTDPARALLGPPPILTPIEVLADLGSRGWITAEAALPLYTRPMQPMPRFIVTITERGREVLRARPEGGEE